MGKRVGNALRLSAAAPDARVLNNFPGLYLTEDWTARYWDVGPQGDLQVREAIIQLPLGWTRICPPVAIGYPGCIQWVRRWGVALYPSILEDIGFDLVSLLSHDAGRFPGGDDEELLHLALGITQFDLPGHFIIASDEHPFLLYDPEGIVKGTYTRWCTYLGALAFLVTDGKVNAPFLRLADEANPTYRAAVGYLREALQERRG
jgi:hypothetical protein